MADDFIEVANPPPPAEVRDKRRPKRIIIEADITGKVVEFVELQYTAYSSTDSDLIGKDGANVYKGANAKTLLGKLFKAGAKAEIALRMAEDQIDE